MGDLALLVSIMVLSATLLVFVVTFFMVRFILKKHFPQLRTSLKVLLYVLLILLAFWIATWLFQIASNPMSFVRNLLFLFILENLILCTVYFFKNTLSRLHSAWYILIAIIWLVIASLLSSLIFSSLEIDAIANMNSYIK